ncbi:MULTISPECIES: glucodextranase DOMON-like domain-containing protein [unclassified Haladaptatus]|uniref:glucodextranase DOMON-like domain-containing protein n=1 Tax=unclassified Haladaptatus TaxID=2622732 RepID=UPI00209BDEFC|nr:MULTISPECIES: glucodextranase DOMON-like domain-containing protein [unclassified Haladaptatus]MCO8246284.1 glycoside hydrolase family 15 protein [Haladaptatus sp. AB643]MCO8255186.1 glycoside hydrolase family 15 protein [Haladaptatus sp. AB618]
MTRRTALTLLGAGVTGAMATPITAEGMPTGGTDAHWTTGEKYGVGTVADHDADDPSRVWFTLTEGALTETRFPRIDYINLRTLDFVVAAPKEGYVARSFDVSRLDDDEEGVERTTEMVDDDSLSFRQTITATGDRNWELVVEYAAHPDHDALLADVKFSGSTKYDVYALADTAFSNSGMSDMGHAKSDGSSKYLAGHDTAENDGDAVILDENGDPYNVAGALVADAGFEWTTVDVIGGDSISPLLTDGSADTRYDEATGNIALVGRLGTKTEHLKATVALGFAENADERSAYAEAKSALSSPFSKVRARYAKSWRSYLQGVDVPKSVRSDSDLRRQFNASAMALKAAESKRFRGAGVASPSVPWGDAVVANEPSDYGYNFVWSRDLYQAFTAMSAMGDEESAIAAVEYLYEYQQDEEGFLPQNTFLDGRTRWGGEQMDNISFPQIMAYQLHERHGIGFDDVSYDYGNVRRSTEYVVGHGPATGQERWEEESGYSPSTTAAEIAGLACSAALADTEGEDADALVYLALADDWQAKTEEWMATTEGTEKHTNTPYYFRINDDTDPDDGAPRAINNGGPTLDERNVIDAGFLELVRLGVKPWDDPVVRNSLAVVDDTIKVETPYGPAFYRYNDDGYGEQGEDPNDDYREGGPWTLDNEGQGRLWPIFTGERGEYELLTGCERRYDPKSLLGTMAKFANSGGMIPEQVWDRPDPTDYGWEFGEGTGSATPLSWSMAQFVRLAYGVEAGRPVETPKFVAGRYADGEVPDGPNLSVEFPSSPVTDRTVTISGETDGATVVVKTPTDTVVREGGEFSVEVEVGDGESGITVAAATDTDSLDELGTVVRRKTVAYVDVGDEVATWDDPEGDDDGPGSYTYPTSGEFVDGAFDIKGFGVYETDDSYQFLLSLAGELTNPWGGNKLSLQTIQVYLRDPDESDADGTTAAREGVNATFEAPYHYRVVAEGFVPARVEGADGGELTQDVTITGYGSVDAVKLELPKSVFGDLTGMRLVPLLLGQDGYSPGRIRPVNATAGGYTFGGGRDDSMNPNVIDLVTPDGVSQSDALAYSADELATIPYLSL